MLIDDLKTIIPFWNKLNNEEQSLIINNTKEVTYDRKVMFMVVDKNVQVLLL